MRMDTHLLIIILGFVLLVTGLLIFYFVNDWIGIIIEAIVFIMLLITYLIVRKNNKVLEEKIKELEKVM